jgi:hypothetical protein
MCAHEPTRELTVPVAFFCGCIPSRSYAAVNFFTISACQMDVSVEIAGTVLQVIRSVA